eukprot:gene12195-13451_t
MPNQSIFRLIFTCGCFMLLLPVLHANLDADYAHSAFLDPDEIFKLYWTPNHKEKTINFAAEVKTTGWVGFGISPGLTGSMKGSDIVMGYVDSNGKGHLSDYHATGKVMPLLDSQQNYQLTASSQNAGTTILQFKRKLTTCDKNDLDIPLGTTKVIYAYGPTDEISFHHERKGARSLSLMNYVKNIPPQTAKHFDVKIRNVSVPKHKTTYWCEAFKLSDLITLNSTQHIIEIGPLVEKKDKGVVHHMVLYACQNSFDDTHLNASGACYHPNMPDSIKQCAGGASVYAWAVGGVNFKFPTHVGLSIGAAHSMKYVVLETHFDNPSERTDFVVTTGLRFFYDSPRQYEAETITVGTTVSGSLLIPPKQKEWYLKGYCSKECTEKLASSDALPGNEIRLFASFPHAHTTGTGIWTKHIRNGKELPEVFRDENYDFDYQQTYLLKKEIKFKAGDEMITYCRFNTMKRKDAVVGGQSTKEEMCLNFIMYYPRVNLTTCISHDILVPSKFAKKYARPVFEGPHNKFNRSQPIQPIQYRNWTNVAWNNSMVDELQKIFDYNGPHPSIYPVCRGTFGHFFPLNATRKIDIKTKLPARPNPCVNKIPSSDKKIMAAFIQVIFLLSLTAAILNELQN